MLVEAVLYRDGCRRIAGELAEVAAGAADGSGFVWVGLHDPDAGEILEVAKVFELHPLAVEDAIKARQRPKVERYDNWLFTVLSTGRYLDEPEEIDFGEIQMFANDAAIVIIRRGEPAPLAAVRGRLESEPERLSAGPVAVLHAVIDEVVDAYQQCLAGLDDDVNEVELEVFASDRPSSSTPLVERIYFLQREILELHRALQPLDSALATLRADPLVTAQPEWDAYFRDIEDHLHRDADHLHTLRDLLGATLHANATQISLRQNEDMRRISAWVAMFAVPTMVAGVYGMNFEHMPELGWIAGYPFALGLMAVGVGGLYRFFRRSGWL